MFQSCHNYTESFLVKGKNERCIIKPRHDHQAGFKASGALVTLRAAVLRRMNSNQLHQTFCAKPLTLPYMTLE